MRRNYTFKFLVENPGFRKWILAPTPELKEEWESIYRENPDCQHTFDSAREFILGVQKTAVPFSETQKKESWERIKNGAGIRQTPKILPLNNSIKIREENLKRRYWVVAACLAALLVSMFVVNSITYEKPGQNVQLSLITKSNGAGQKSKIHLPDGSVVILNSESSLTYNSEFSKAHRKVQLKGEAFFDVVKDPARPFIVQSENVLTTALGTSFNVNASLDKDISIVLVSGKIKVNELDSDEQKVLNEGEMVRYHKGRGFEQVQPVASLDAVLWKDGIIVFNDTPLPRVIEELERWYGVNIEVEGEVSTLTFSGIYDNEYLSNLLKSMAFALEFEYQLDGDNVKLKF